MGVYDSYRAIAAAAHRGAISPGRALELARWAASGGDVSALDDLTGPGPEQRLRWMRAAARPDFAAQLLDILTQMVGQAVSSQQPGSQQSGDAYDNLFPADYRAVTTRPGSRPPGAQEYVPQPTVYPGESQGQRGRRPVQSWDGYVVAEVGPGEMSDEEADLLLPPRTPEESERRARRVEASAAYVEDLSDDELYRRLFGDTPGDAG